MAGFAAKKLTKVAAIALGLTFIVVQVLVYYRMVTVDWGEVEARATGLLTDTHGHGVAEQFWQIVTTNLPFGAAFGVGFAIGFKKG